MLIWRRVKKKILIKRRTKVKKIKRGEKAYTNNEKVKDNISEPCVIILKFLKETFG